MNRLSIMGVVVVLLLLAGFLNNPAAAYHRHGYHHRAYHHVVYRNAATPASDRGCTFTNEGREQCASALRQNRMAAIDGNGNRAYASVDRVYASADQGTVIGARPDGCPHAYCGCGLRKYLGLADVRLNLASNWARLFPREAAPRAGLAAVRSGHVMYIEAAAGNGNWLIRDYNSGGGLSRLHVRDLRGYVFVNPRG